MSSSWKTPTARSFIVMGVSGVGKSAVGRRLASALGIDFVEGDDFHPPQNVAKMSRGIPLDDTDRGSWLPALRTRLETAVASGESIVMTCSALKRRYRDVLRQADAGLLFIHLVGERDLIASRLSNRRGHFMPATLLDSQLDELEPPGTDENALSLDINQPQDRIVATITRHLA